MRKPHYVIAFESNLDLMLAELMAHPDFDAEATQRYGEQIAELLRGVRGGEGVVSLLVMVKVALEDLEAQVAAGALSQRPN